MPIKCHFQLVNSSNTVVWISLFTMEIDLNGVPAFFVQSPCNNMRIICDSPRQWWQWPSKLLYNIVRIPFDSDEIHQIQLNTYLQPQICDRILSIHIPQLKWNWIGVIMIECPPMVHSMHAWSIYWAKSKQHEILTSYCHRENLFENQIVKSKHFCWKIMV